MAFTLVHEVQHADVLIGAANHCNDVDSDKVLPNGKKAKAYGLQQIQRLTDADKVKNAQNYAWFGLLVRLCLASMPFHCSSTIADIRPT